MFKSIRLTEQNENFFTFVYPFNLLYFCNCVSDEKYFTNKWLAFAIRTRIEFVNFAESRMCYLSIAVSNQMSLAHHVLLFRFSFLVRLFHFFSRISYASYPIKLRFNRSLYFDKLFFFDSNRNANVTSNQTEKTKM